MNKSSRSRSSFPTRMVRINQQRSHEVIYKSIVRISISCNIFVTLMSRNCQIDVFQFPNLAKKAKRNIIPCFNACQTSQFIPCSIQRILWPIIGRIVYDMLINIKIEYTADKTITFDEFFQYRRTPGTVFIRIGFSTG
jgi:hypothetical protein